MREAKLNLKDCQQVSFLAKFILATDYADRFHSIIHYLFQIQSAITEKLYQFVPHYFDAILNCFIPLVNLLVVNFIEKYLPFHVLQLLLLRFNPLRQKMCLHYLSGFQFV